MTAWSDPDADPAGDVRAAIEQAEKDAKVPLPPQEPCTDPRCHILVMHTHPWLNGVRSGRETSDNG